MRRISNAERYGREDELGRLAVPQASGYRNAYGFPIGVFYYGLAVKDQ